MVSKLDTTRITIPRSTKLQVRSTAALSSACLIQYSGDTLGRRYLLDVPEITIGRSYVNGIMIHDDSVSRQHVKIILSGNVVSIEDLGSSNGTFIHDEPVKTRTILIDGDILRLGNILLKFFSHDNVESVFHDNIYRLTTLDVGTGLFNKKYLLETLETEFRFCLDNNRPLSVIYYDLDNFKSVNDQYGHTSGDVILRECAQLVKTCMRAEDVLARYGGEEFVAVLPNTDVRNAAGLAERIRESIQNYDFVVDRKIVKQTVSLGVSENGPGFKFYMELLDDADRKLYQSKKTGRNRVTT